VEPSPHYQRPIQAVASYNQPPAFSDSLHGHFFVPYPPDGTPPDEVQKRLEGNCSAGIPTTAVHEAYPGHHWHLVTMKAHPSPIRLTFRTPYFSEGWALYAEHMMREQGFFNPAYVQQMIRDHADLKADYSRNLWGLLIFALWHEKFGSEAPVTSVRAASGRLGPPVRPADLRRRSA